MSDSIDIEQPLTGYPAEHPTQQQQQQHLVALTDEQVAITNLQHRVQRLVEQLEHEQQVSRARTTELAEANTARAGLQDQLAQINQQGTQAQPFAPAAPPAPFPSFVPPATSHSKEPKIAMPPVFTGKKSEASEFMIKVEQYFACQPSTYSSDAIKLAFVTNLLKDDAFRWYEPYARLRGADRPIWLSTWSAFQVEFESHFSITEVKESARRKLNSLSQGNGSASAYADKFDLLISYLDMTDETKRQIFFDGLSSEVQTHLLSPGRFAPFPLLVKEAIQYDDLRFNLRLAQKHGNNNRNSQQSSHRQLSRHDNSYRQSRSFTESTMPVPASSQPDNNAMEIDAVRVVTPEEKERRRKEGLCFYCGGKHKYADCNKRKKANRDRPTHQGNSKP